MVLTQPRLNRRTDVTTIFTPIKARETVEYSTGSIVPVRAPFVVKEPMCTHLENTNDDKNAIDKHSCSEH